MQEVLEGYLFALAEVKALKDQPVKTGHPHQLSETAVPSPRHRFGVRLTCINI